MQNLVHALRNEITRLAKKETKGQITALKAASGRYRREIAELKRVTWDLERRLAHMEKQERKRAKKSPSPELAEGTRFSARGLKSHRVIFSRQTEPPRTSAHSPVARSNAAPHSPPASSHRSTPSLPAPGLLLPAHPAPSETQPDASTASTVAASWKSSNDPASSRPGRTQGSSAATTSPPPATRCLAPSPVPRSTRPASFENTRPARYSVVHTGPGRTADGTVTPDCSHITHP